MLSGYDPVESAVEIAVVEESGDETTRLVEFNRSISSLGEFSGMIVIGSCQRLYLDGSLMPPTRPALYAVVSLQLLINGGSGLLRKTSSRFGCLLAGLSIALVASTLETGWAARRLYLLQDQDWMGTAFKLRYPRAVSESESLLQADTTPTDAFSSHGRMQTLLADYPLNPQTSLPPVTRFAQADSNTFSAVEKVVFANLSFVGGSKELSEVGKGRCQLILKRFRQHRLINVVIETASGVDREQAVELALERARALRDTLESLGIPQELITEPKLLDSERSADSGSGWAKSVMPTVQFLILTGAGH